MWTVSRALALNIDRGLTSRSWTQELAQLECPQCQFLNIELGLGRYIWTRRYLDTT